MTTASAADIAAALAVQAEQIAIALLGKPSSTTQRELRFGSRGSFALCRHGAKRGRWFDHERAEGGDMLHLVARERGVPLGEAMRIARRDYLGGTISPIPRPRPEPPPTDDAGRTRGALAIWHEAEPITGTLAETYLRRRGIDTEALPNDMREVLRWHPRCPWQASRQGCMVALWSDAVTARPRAIHRTAITPSGEKIDRRSLGPTSGCVIRLWPDEDVTHGLVLGEGIETTLAAATRIVHRGTLLRPAWAAGDSGHIAAFPVLAGIECLTLLVDHDDAGRGAAEQCSRCWTAAGREVVRLTPRSLGADFNELISRNGDYGLSELCRRDS
jgi:putative DNA primase/helicase